MLHDVETVTARSEHHTSWKTIVIALHGISESDII